MIVKSLHITHFRNHSDTSVHFSPGINILVGLNGSGKTNLLDALHVLFMSRSFVTTSDQHLLQQGADQFNVEAQLEGKIRSQFSLACTYKRIEGKKFFVNKSPLEKLTELIGLVPVVVLSPDDRRLTKEGPAERRAFLDAMISQTSKSYLMHLVDYKRVLKQRNRLLAEFHGRLDELELQIAPWDAQLAKAGAAITEERTRVLERFCELLSQVYLKLGLDALKPGIDYRAEEPEPASRVEEENPAVATLEQYLLEALERKLPADFERGSTSVGPHRDDLVFSLNGRDLRKFGSQGQHRLFAIALKLAQLSWYSEVLKESPILILDDMFGELDAEKTKSIAALLAENKFQTFISVAKEGLILPHLEHVNEMKLLKLDGGKVVG